VDASAEKDIERPPEPGVEKLPAHELVYRRIRDMILYGELAPGQGVTIQGLASALGAGMTPVREAIRRLSAEGALDFLGNRRVCVPVLTLEQADELEFARATIEPRIARQAAEKITPADIAGLDVIDQTLNAAIRHGDVQGYLQQNHRFHATIYAVSEARILISVVDKLWLRIGPSLRVVCGRFGTYNLPDKHEEALAAMRAGDPDAVAHAIEGDVRQGMEQVRLALLQGDF
jgi:DNA-binding GntR family transcriptional regulator